MKIHITLLTMLICMIAPSLLAGTGLEITEPAKDKALFLGHKLSINATDALAESIRTELKRPGAPQRLRLFLGNVEVKGMALSSHNVDLPEPPDKVIDQLKADSDAKSKIAEDDKRASDAAPTDDAKKSKAKQSETDAKTAKTALDDAKKLSVNVHFIVERNSEDDDARNAWDAILRQAHLFKPADLPVALAVGDQSPLYVGTVQFQASSWVWGGIVGGSLALVFGVIVLWRWSSLIRDDGDTAKPYSLGRLQMAFWGILVLACWVGVAITSVRMEHIPMQTLALMGISAATGVGSMLIGGNKTFTEVTRGFWSDICVGDNGPSFQRVQIVCWTAVLGVFFVTNVILTMSMPEVSSTLLLLMGLSSATYLGSKPQENNSPPKVLEIRTFAINDNELAVTVVGGSEPYELKIEGGQLVGLSAGDTEKKDVKSGTVTKLTVTKPTADGTLKLTVTDKSKAEKTAELKVVRPNNK